MLKRIKKTNSEGFTIIEVMIVLAIAALILLIVLLAVPALQRSASNTSRKNDASAIAAAISNYINNNSGNLPGGINTSAGANIVLITDAADAGSSAPTGNSERANLGYYKSSNIFWGSTVTTATAPTDNPTTAASGSNVTTESVAIIPGESCDGGAATSNLQVSARDVSVFYATDSGGGQAALQCVSV
ncbi:MAG TPA: prepilin-type N-terminal cleavage/methylation domain-containing protein [Candidatus Saccharimonadales bacterium]|nr:prepilin-type N-terminal cleavage/methylation domain-containing protein [Candidatus Saccharimonadales bacterium]